MVIGAADARSITTVPDPTADPLLAAEDEAAKAEGLARTAEIGAIAAEVALLSAKKTPERSPELAPLAMMAATKSRLAAALASECSAASDRLAAMVRDELTVPEPPDEQLVVGRVSRTGEACSKAVAAAQNADKSAKRAEFSAGRVDDLANTLKTGVEPTVTAQPDIAKAVPAAPQPGGQGLGPRKAPAQPHPKREAGEPGGKGASVSGQKKRAPGASKEAKKRGILDRLADLFSE